MIQLSKNFLMSFRSEEQLIMLRLLMDADNNGVVEFSDRGISRLTEIPYQQVRTIHQKWISDGIITNAPANAGTNAKQCFVTICDYDSYNVINFFSNAVTNAVANALKEQEERKKTDKDFPQTPLQTEKINKQEQEFITPYNPPAGDESKVLAKLAEMEKSFSELTEENKRLQDELKSLKEKKHPPFVPPSEQEVADYIAEKGYHFDAGAFISFYTSNGWMVGKNKMKDWKAACKTWESHRNKDSRSEESPVYENSGSTMVERFANWVDRYYPTIRDMEMPNNDQLNEMLRICNNEIEGYLDRLQDDYHTGSLYDLFIERFGNG